MPGASGYDDPDCVGDPAVECLEVTVYPFEDAVLDTLVADTTLTALAADLPVDLSPNGVHGWGWRVRGEHDWGVGTWSTETAFTIKEAAPRRYYVTDHLGSTRAVVDPSRPEGDQVVESRDYIPDGGRGCGWTGGT